MKESINTQAIPTDSDLRPEPEKVFEANILANLTTTYISDMRALGYTDEYVEGFLKILNSKEPSDRKKILSIPFELRSNVLKNYLNQLQAAKMTMQEVADEILETANQFGFDIGYHTTPYQIKKERLANGNIQWNVNGSEQDHRDNDITMAYYSKDLENIYLKKDFKYVYIIRSSSDHKENGKWYRAPRLPIISEIPMSSAELQDKYILYKEALEKTHIPD